MSLRFIFLSAAFLFLVISPLSIPLLADDLTNQTSTSSYEPKDTGGYVERESTTTKNEKGTVTTEKVTKDVTYDRDGNKIETDDIKNISDPKGLFNKSTTEIVNKSAEMPDGGKLISHKELLNGKTTEENTEKISPP